MGSIKYGPIGITTGGLSSANAVTITASPSGSGYPHYTWTSPNPYPSPFIPLQISYLGTAVPNRTLTQQQALQVLPAWIRWYLEGKLEIYPEMDAVVLFHVTLRLKLTRNDYNRFTTLVTKEPWTSGYNLPEPLKTQWIASAIQAVFKFSP